MPFIRYGGRQKGRQEKEKRRSKRSPLSKRWKGISIILKYFGEKLADFFGFSFENMKLKEITKLKSSFKRELKPILF